MQGYEYQCKWQQQAPYEWVLGYEIRGFMRYRLAGVGYDHEDGMWSWVIYRPLRSSDGEIKLRGNTFGKARHLHEAIDAVEQSLGLRGS